MGYSLGLIGCEYLLAGELPAERIGAALKLRLAAQLVERQTRGDPGIAELRGDRHSGLTAQYAFFSQGMDRIELHCVHRLGALALLPMPRKQGPRGRRSPCPDWWVREANARLERRGLQKKRLAAILQAKSYPISETMVIRCLHEDEHRRIATIEAIEAISDALGIPRPVVVAQSLEQAMEIQAAVQFSRADADALALVAEDSQPMPVSIDNHGDGEVKRTGTVTALGRGGSRALGGRRQTVRFPGRNR